MAAHLEIPDENLAVMEQFARDNAQPIVMVNLMSLREIAEYEAEGLANCSGSEAFARYTQESSEVRQQAGAKLIWSGKALHMPIGPAEKTWDMVALVEYPSARAYLDMKSTAAYQAARLHRRAALLDSRLIMTAPNG